jgi:excisionase family DNA binding protein
MADHNQDAGNEPLWSALEVARYLSVSRATVYNLADRGILPVTRIGALLRFSPDAIRKFASTPRLPAPVVPLKTRKTKKPDGDE